MGSLIKSTAELAYIYEGLQQNIRTDGRSCLQYRDISLKTSEESGSIHAEFDSKGNLIDDRDAMNSGEEHTNQKHEREKNIMSHHIFPTTNGSAHLQLGVSQGYGSMIAFGGCGGVTEVQVGIKVGIIQPRQDQDTKTSSSSSGGSRDFVGDGIVEVECEITNSVAIALSNDFHVVNGSSNRKSASGSGNLSDAQVNSSILSSQLSSIMKKIILGGKWIDTKKLVIVPNKYCFIVYIDILILKLDGNIIDALSMAIYAALRTTRIPKLDPISISLPENAYPIQSEKENMVASSGDASTNEKIADFQLHSDIYESVELPLLQPGICITVNRIGKCLVLDATYDEEVCYQGIRCDNREEEKSFISPYNTTVTPCTSITYAITASGKITSIHMRGQAGGLKGTPSVHDIMKINGKVAGVAQVIHKKLDEALGII